MNAATAATAAAATFARPGMILAISFPKTPSEVPRPYCRRSRPKSRDRPFKGRDADRYHLS
jgi:hypothetical protein